MQNNQLTSQSKWWALLIKGILLVILGLVALMNIKATVVALYFWLGYYFLIQSMIEFANAWFQHRVVGGIWPILARGLLNLVLGTMVFLLPKATVSFVIVLIVAYAILQGVIDLFFAIRFRKELEISRIVLLWLSGVAQLLFAFWMFLHPILGGITLILVVAIYTIVVGLITILRAFLERNPATPVSV